MAQQRWHSDPNKYTIDKKRILLAINNLLPHYITLTNYCDIDVTIWYQEYKRKQIKLRQILLKEWKVRSFPKVL